MNSIRFFFLLLLASGWLAAGCEDITSKGSQAGKAPARAISPPSELDNFPGGYLVVQIDGERTEESHKENHEQIWTVEAIRPTPTIIFTMDEMALGALKNASPLVFQPIVNGEVIEGDIYQYAGGRDLQPGVPLQLNTFTHIYDDQLDTNLNALPPGRYRLSVQVHGTDHWDRQRIDTEVK